MNSCRPAQQHLVVSVTGRHRDGTWCPFHRVFGGTLQVGQVHPQGRQNPDFQLHSSPSPTPSQAQSQGHSCLWNRPLWVQTWTDPSGNCPLQSHSMFLHWQSVCVSHVSPHLVYWWPLEPDQRQYPPEYMVTTPQPEWAWTRNNGKLPSPPRGTSFGYGTHLSACCRLNRAWYNRAITALYGKANKHIQIVEKFLHSYEQNWKNAHKSEYSNDEKSDNPILSHNISSRVTQWWRNKNVPCQLL